MKGMEPAHWTRFLCRLWEKHRPNNRKIQGLVKEIWVTHFGPKTPTMANFRKGRNCLHTHMPSRVVRTPQDTQDLGCIKVVPLQEHLGTLTTKKTRRRRASWTAGTHGADYNLSLFFFLPPVSYYFYPSLSQSLSLHLSLSLLAVK